MAQECSLYPNSQSTLSEYGIKKITVFLEPYNGKKELEAVYFLDSTGCAFQWISRKYFNNKFTYYITREQGSYQVGKKERYHAQFDKDSVEKLIERRIDHYSNTGRRWKEEVWSPVDGKIKKRTVLYGPNEPDTLDRKTYFMDEAGDTVRKSTDISNPKEAYHISLLNENGTWVEEQKWETKRSENGTIKEHRRWERGKLIEGKKFVERTINDYQTEVVETDLDGNPRSKTVYESNGDYSIYTFNDGKWIFQYEERMPESDPIDDHKPEIIPDELEKKQKATKPKKAAKAETQSVRVKHKKLSKSPPVVKLTYRDPSKKDVVIMKETFTQEGLILESDIIWDKKKRIYEYEF